MSGKVLDIYQIDGHYHSCHPEAVITVATPFSKNKRVITIIDTDMEGGTQAGLVAMIEVAALLVGDIVQCYSEDRYDHPQPVIRGLFLKKGQPKSLFRPGSSTSILIFQKNRVLFCKDLIHNQNDLRAQSIYSKSFGQPFAETEIMVRSALGCGWLSGPNENKDIVQESPSPS